MVVLTHYLWLILLIVANSGGAYTWVNYLTQPGELFGFVRKAYNNRTAALAEAAYMECPGEDVAKKTECYQSVVSRREFIAKPLFSCHRCVAGWVGIISYMLIAIFNKLEPEHFHIYSYRPVEHLVVVLWSILGTEFIARILR